ncbi:Calcium uniporter protein 2 protein [Thalictrum thalictroides]|uniref:Calcium uniporter protein 2 protein n=1 Tax=Thalictrum thalictroides TaxID=46969 RepID=A0A7J6V9P9_THATH|nr:Calcium uniporter protein 2 protein [Thalictrum thalictroides]
MTFRRDFLNASGGGSDNDQKSDIGGFFRRFLQKRAIVQSATTKSSNPSKLFGDKLMNKLKDMNMNEDNLRRLRLDGLYPYPPTVLELKPPEEEKAEMMNNVSIEDAKKLLRVSQVQMLKAKFRQIPQNRISYNEFLEICVENSGSDHQGLTFAKMLDDSGSVIVLGNLVFLRPEQVTKAIEGILPLSIPQPNDAKQKELEKMEKEKMEIDKEAEALVRKELWAGLGFMVAQTAGLMRLTFWELSWDVMEPICFYITSIYFMAGYSFFLRTSKDPSFEGIFASRFTAKQKCLMKKKNFDLQKFNELRRACYPLSAREPPLVSIQSFEASDKTPVRAFGQ